MLRLIPLTLLLGAAACSTTPVVVRTAQGPVIGAQQGGTRAFRGIPYAAPPVGPRRFRPPEPVAKWSEPLDATRPGKACPQPNTGGYIRESSEDCLSLNVWTPAQRQEARLPVLVWIHGGAFLQGSANDALYDGRALAEAAAAVVVTLNYRLGALGFLSHPALAKELGAEVSPSVGLLDQRAALRWVAENVAAFGGDPGKVTIFGCSAGAWSVCAQLASPKSEGLFAGAIMQSGACSDALYFSGAEANAQGERLAAAVGCAGEDAPECLRSKSAEALIAALPPKRGMILTPGIWWGPVVDGVELPKLPLQAMRAGSFAHVPLIIGSNEVEGVLHTLSFEQITPLELESFARDVFGARAASLVPAHYAGAATPKDALNDVITEGVFSCNARRVARVLSQQNMPVFLYQMRHPLDHPKAHGLGATHSVELFFVWGNTDLGIGISEAERPLSRRFMQAWGRFAATGDPSGPELSWPRYTAERDPHLVFDMASSVGSGLANEACDFWDEIDRQRDAAP